MADDGSKTTAAAAATTAAEGKMADDEPERESHDSTDVTDVTDKQIESESLTTTTVTEMDESKSEVNIQECTTSQLTGSQSDTDLAERTTTKVTGSRSDTDIPGRKTVTGITGSQSEPSVLSRLVETDSTYTEPDTGERNGETIDISTQCEENFTAPVPVKRSSISSGSQVDEDSELIENPCLIDSRSSPTRETVVNVFDKYPYLTVTGILCAGVTIFLGICHLLHVIVNSPSGYIRAIDISLDISMVGFSILIIISLYSYLTEAWTFGLHDLIIGLLHCILNLACPSVILFLGNDQLTITTFVSSAIVLVSWLFFIFCYCREQWIS
ncbi:hypothetical protein Ahia01_001334400 [Argonauta hians]